jgi:hypothetical protein
MFTAKGPRSRAAAHAREVTAGQNSTSGGAWDAEVSELTVIRTDSPEGLRPVTTAIGCSRSRKTCRRSSTATTEPSPGLHRASWSAEAACDAGAVIAVARRGRQSGR